MGPWLPCPHPWLTHPSPSLHKVLELRDRLGRLLPLNAFFLDYLKHGQRVALVRDNKVCSCALPCLHGGGYGWGGFMRGLPFSTSLLPPPSTPAPPHLPV